MPVPETEITQAEIQTTIQQAVVEVTEDEAVNIVIVSVSEEPTVVTTGIVGPQGPTYVPPSFRHDFSTPYDYCGLAPGGTLDSESEWNITRITVQSDGSTTTQSATGVTWTGRASHTYS